MNTPRPIGQIHSYHAHVYYDPATSRDAADAVRVQIGERFSVQMGRWHDVLVGPHTRAMYQVAFTPDVFPTLVPWLMLNHGALAVLIHPNTDNPHDDHLAHALWLGETLPVNAERLPHSMAADGHDHSPIQPNTTPTILPEQE